VSSGGFLYPTSYSPCIGEVLLGHLVEGLACHCMDRLLACLLLPPTDRQVHIARLNLERVADPAYPLCGKQRRTRPQEGVEHNLTARGAVQKRVCHERNRFDCGVHGEDILLAPHPRESVRSRIVPDIGAITAEAAKLNVVAVYGFTVPIHEDQLVSRFVKRPHTTYTLGPHTHVQKLAIHRSTCRHQFLNMPPVHTYEVNRAIRTPCRKLRKTSLQEFGELCPTHLPRSHGEFGVMDLAIASGIAIDHYVVGWIDEDDFRATVLHQARKAVCIP